MKRLREKVKSSANKLGNTMFKLKNIHNRGKLFEDSLTPEERVVYQKSFLEVRNFYNDAIIRIQKENKEKIEAFLIPALSRSPYEGSVFRKLLRHQFNFNLSKKDSLQSEIMPNLIESLIIVLKSCLSSIYHLQKQRRFSKKVERSSIELKEIDILVDEYLVPASVENDSYFDRYFPGFFDLINEKTLSRSAILFSFGTIKDYSELEINFLNCKISQNFLFKENFLKFSDYVFSFCSYFRAKRIIIPPMLLNGLDVRALIKKEILLEGFSHNTITSNLSYRFSKRLFEENINVNFFINWFENQLVDKGLNKGFHQFMPKTKRIGFQSWIASPYVHFHNAPTSDEVLLGYAPPIICPNGPALTERGKEFLSEPQEVTFIQAPSFRFKSIFEVRDKATSSIERKPILVLLPILLDQSLEIINSVKRVLKEENELTFVLKFHPAFLDEWKQGILKGLGQYSERIKVSKEELSSISYASNIVISGSSSACVEALALKCFCIVFAPTLGAYESTIPENTPESIWILVTDSETLIKAIQKLSKKDLDNPSDNQFLNKFKYDFFNPPRKKGLSPLFPSEFCK